MQQAASHITKVGTFFPDLGGFAALAMLSIEKKLTQNIPDFNMKVIEKFTTQKDRRVHVQIRALYPSQRQVSLKMFIDMFF